MATNHLMRKRALRYAVEPSTYAAYQAPTIAVPILDDLAVKPWAGSQVKRATVRPYLGNIRSIPVGEYATLDFSVELAGSGAAATAPAYAGLLKACGFASETILGSAVTGTAQAGSTSTTIKLASGASATDGLYVGMTVSTTGGTGSGQAREIIAYNGTTKVATVSSTWTTTPDATTTYSIGACVGYLPVSGFGTGTSVTVECYYGAESGSGATRHVFVGCRGNVSLELSKDAIPKLKFSFMGLVYAHEDTTLPTLDFSGWQTAVPVTTAYTGSHLQIAGIEACVLESLTIDGGMNPVYRGVVNDTSIRITDRNATAKANVAAWALSEADFWAKLRQGQESPLLIRHGTVAGNIVTLSAPSAQVVNVGYTDIDGIAHLDLDLQLNVGNAAGNDEFRITTK